MRAHARAPALAAEAPLAAMLVDARAPAVLAPAPTAVMLADARAPAVLAPSPDAVMLADAPPRVVLLLLRRSAVDKRMAALAALDPLLPEHPRPRARAHCGHWRPGRGSCPLFPCIEVSCGRKLILPD